MITIIHGDDIVSSREALTQLKNEANKVGLELDIKSLSLEKIKQEFEGGGLLEQDKIIIIENLLNSGEKELIAYLREVSLPFDLVLWEEKDISPKILNDFPKARILHFKLKPLIFSFLDNIRPSQNKLAIQLFHEVLKTTNPEIVFYMLVRHFRLMLSILGGGKIDEVNRLVTWQLNKLKKQASLIGLEKLVLLYQKLFEIEVKQKTGKTSLTLVQSIDFFLLDL